MRRKDPRFLVLAAAGALLLAGSLGAAFAASKQVPSEVAATEPPASSALPSPSVAGGSELPTEAPLVAIEASPVPAAATPKAKAEVPKRVSASPVPSPAAKEAGKLALNVSSFTMKAGEMHLNHDAFVARAEGGAVLGKLSQDAALSSPFILIQPSASGGPWSAERRGGILVKASTPPGTYSAGLTAKDASGKEYKASISVKVTEQPNFSLSLSLDGADETGFDVLVKVTRNNGFSGTLARPIMSLSPSHLISCELVALDTPDAYMYVCDKEDPEIGPLAFSVGAQLHSGSTSQKAQLAVSLE